MEFNATFLISTISFILFTIIMNFIFYKPIENIVKKRQTYIDKNYYSAEENDLISQQINNECENMINNTKIECNNIIKEKTESAKKTKANLVKEAHIKAINSIKENQQELNSSQKDVETEIFNNISELTQAITKKLFEKT